MNTIEVINAYDSLLDRLALDIKSSHYKIQFFLDLLGVKRSFFYKKLKEKRFTPDELRLIYRNLQADEYNNHEIEAINKLIEKSREDFKNGKFDDFETLIASTRKKYGL